MTEPAVIAPSGELDLHAVGELSQDLEEALGAEHPHLILDLSAVTLVDSTAFGAIVNAQHRLDSQGRRLSLIAPNGSAAAVVLELTGLRPRFSVFASRDAVPA